MALDLVRRLALEGLLTEAEESALIARRAAFGEPVPVALFALKIASPAAVSSLFERMGFAPATRLKPAPSARALPPGMLRAFWSLPIGESPAGVVVAMVDPTDAHVLREMEYHLRKPVDPRLARVDELGRILLEIDPPPEAPETRTRRAPAPPPPSPADATVMRPVVPALEAEVLSFASRPRHRRLTLAYGEPTVDIEDGRVVSAGTSDLHGEGARAVRLGPVAGAIGAYTSSRTTARAPAEPGPARESEAPIPLRRKPSKPQAVVPAPVPIDALHAIAELRMASDRDAIGRIAVRGLLAVAERAAFFVVKRGVVQGWEGATLERVGGAGLSREALRNLWIPVTAASVFRLVSERGASYAGPLSDSTADSILAASLGGRPSRVLLAPIQVRGHVVAFLYADGFADAKAAQQRADELVVEVAEALERWLVASRSSR